MSYSELTEQFLKQFELILASDAILQDEVYKIRYKVYCEELAYENTDQFPSKREIDKFDQNSIHCLLKHKASGLWAGCVRVVFPNTRTDGDVLPFEHYFGPFSEMSQSYAHKLDHVSINCIGEVSRLAVPTEFRRRKGEKNTADGAINSNHSLNFRQRRQLPIIPLSLYLAASSIVMQNGLEFAITVMEPRLARHLRLFGIRFIQISDCVDLNGKRGLFALSPQGLLENIKPDCHELLDLIQGKLAAASKPKSHNSLTRGLEMSHV